MVYKPCSVDPIREWKFLANLHKDASVQNLKLINTSPGKDTQKEEKK